MSKHAHLGLAMALFLCFPIDNAEAGMNKCTDGKQITYTNEPCEKTGLSSAGPIKNAVTVMPVTTSTQSQSSGKAGKDKSESSNASKSNTSKNYDSDADVSREVTIKPVSPLVDKMLNW